MISRGATGNVQLAIESSIGHTIDCVSRINQAFHMTTNASAGAMNKQPEDHSKIVVQNSMPGNGPRRPSWNEYFLNIAFAVALRADCSRRKVGAVIVRDNRIVSTGYNGSPPGGPSCLAGQCPRAASNVPAGSSYDTGPGSCIAAHAEQNAIIYAGRSKCLGATIYVTEIPCGGCQRMIKAAGIEYVVSPE